MMSESESGCFGILAALCRRCAAAYSAYDPRAHTAYDPDPRAPMIAAPMIIDSYDSQRL